MLRQLGRIAYREKEYATAEEMFRKELEVRLTMKSEPLDSAIGIPDL